MISWVPINMIQTLTDNFWNIVVNYRPINLIMVPFISDIGVRVKDVVPENNFGRMDQFMRDIGKIIRQMEKED